MSIFLIFILKTENRNEDLPVFQIVHGMLEYGFADLKHAVGIRTLADDEALGIEIIEDMAGGVDEPLRIIIVMDGRRIGVSTGEHVATESEVIVGQAQLS